MGTMATEQDGGGLVDAPYVEGLAAGKLRYQRCAACGTVQTLARHACAHCGRDALAWHDASGLATVHAVTVVHRAPSPVFKALVPYTLVVAQTDEGARFMGHAEAGVRIGDRVAASFFEWDGHMLVRFQFPRGVS